MVSLHVKRTVLRKSKLVIWTKERRKNASTTAEWPLRGNAGGRAIGNVAVREWTALQPVRGSTVGRGTTITGQLVHNLVSEYPVLYVQ